MAKLKEVLAFVNNKGGVAKTTTVQNVAAGIIRKNPKAKILVIDLDPQSHLSLLMRWSQVKDNLINDGTAKVYPVDEETKEVHFPTITDVLGKAETDGQLTIYPSYIDGLWFIPASRDLESIDSKFNEMIQPNLALEQLFGVNYLLPGEITAAEERFIADDFDYIFIDCPPALGKLSYNALSCATGIIIPVQLEALSTYGLSRVIEAYTKVKKFINKELSIRGLLFVMADKRMKVTKETMASIRDRYTTTVFNTVISLRAAIRESQFVPTDIFDYDQNCAAAKNYAEFVDELLSTSPSD